MRVNNIFEFEVEFFTACHSIEKVITLTPEETANLYRWTFRLPLSEPVDLDLITEDQFENMKNELAYQYLYCYIGDPDATFDATLLAEWIQDCCGK